MSFVLAVLPFARNALVPHISEETLEFHYGRHHQTYVNNLNQLVANTEFANKSLIEVVHTASGSIFNNAAQIWNHDFYWNSLCSASEHCQPSQELTAAIDDTFGSMIKFQEAFTKAALGLLGSGWVWLVKDAKGLMIATTSNAGTPVASGQVPLFTCDVWEHAYYIDYRNARAKYLEAFWQIINWQFANSNFANF